MRERDASHVSPVWGRITDLVIRSGEGCVVTAEDGTEYLDFTSGIGVTNTGHCHPEVVAAVQAQAATIMHAQVNCYFHPGLLELSAALAEVTPFDSFFFANSGAEAVEAAVKLARHATGRRNLIVFQGGFHGRTAQTMAMTTAKPAYRLDYQPLPGGVIVAPYPYPFRWGLSEEEATARALAELDLLLHSQTAPEETAAVVIEPVLGEGGYLPAPLPFLRALRRLCDEHGILLVADEVQTGFGRTGRLFAFEHAGVTPDVLVMAKGMGSGFPISGVAASRALMEAWRTGTHGGTYGGNPMACAAALATLRVMQGERLPENAAARGEQLTAGLRGLQRRFPVLGDVRGRGLMVGCEFADPRTRAPRPDVATGVLGHALREGRLLLLGCGSYGNSVRWIPPLVVREDEIERGLAAFEAALERTLAELDGVPA